LELISRRSFSDLKFCELFPSLHILHTHHRHFFDHRNETKTAKMQLSNLLLTLLAAASVQAAPTTAPQDAVAVAKRVTAGANDYGKCTPTMSFALGRPGRKATEGTFLPTDPLVTGGQQDALNPNIITNEICNQLTNVCGANAAAKATCLQAKAVVAGLTTRDQSTADAFNKALGL
jgi:hypothetical protein